MLIPCLLALLIPQAGSPIEVRTSGRSGQVQFLAPADATLASPTGTVSTRRGESLLRVSLQTRDQQAGPPIFGAYRYSNGKLQFTPRFRLVPGQTYIITYTPRPDFSFKTKYQAPIHFIRPPPTVTTVYPSAARLPANQLKFYIHFSAPMREGRDIFSKIELLDETGKPLRGPWRRTELWNSDATRFTLWIHPGRIKQGVKLRKDEGPVLVAGKRYTLRVPATLRGADGQHLSRDHDKTFLAMPADSKRPDPGSWKLARPAIDTRQPLRLNFQEPLDHALALRCLRVHDALGHTLKGTVSLAANESTWQFVPSTTWKRMRYQISVSKYLEDLAGNTPDRVFDTDLRASAPAPQTKTLGFRPRQ